MNIICLLDFLCAFKFTQNIWFVDFEGIAAYFFFYYMSINLFSLCDTFSANLIRFDWIRIRLTGTNIFFWTQRLCLCAFPIAMAMATGLNVITKFSIIFSSVASRFNGKIMVFCGTAASLSLVIEAFLPFDIVLFQIC